MAKPGQAQDEAMDAILASIRSMMAEEDRGARQPEAGAEAMAKAVPDNVSRLFSEPRQPPAMDEPPEPSAGVATDGPVRPETAVELAIAQAIEEARAEVEADSHLAEEAPEWHEDPPIPAPEPPPRMTARPERPAPRPASTPSAPQPPRIDAIPPDRALGPKLLSAEADAAVGGAFNQLATTMLSGGSRTIDDLVEDLVRPMLRDWLDDNLPPLVERLVREEIERVSRGRR
jgi:cell pole-organizing protein PopZ